MQNVKIMKFKKYTRMTIENYVYKDSENSTKFIVGT